MTYMKNSAKKPATKMQQKRDARVASIPPELLQSMVGKGEREGQMAANKPKRRKTYA